MSKHASIASQAGGEIVADNEAIRQRLRHHGITEKIQQQARRLKMALEAQPDLVGSFYHSVHTQALPAAATEHFLC